MKKILLAASIALFTASAYADVCSYNGDVAFCEWEQKNCHEISTDYSDAGTPCADNASAAGCGKTCAQALDNCINYGTLYTGVSGLNADNDYGKNTRCKAKGGSMQAGRDPDAEPLGCCKWDNGKGECWTIMSGVDPEDNMTGAEKVEQCKSGANSLWSGKCPNEPSCPSGKGNLYDGTVNDCGVNYCMWDECTKIAPDPDGKYGDATANCEEATNNCKNNGLHYTNSTCSGTATNAANDCGNNYCIWDGECYKVKPDDDNPTCADAITNCSNNGELYSNSSCTGSQIQPPDPSPIIKTIPAQVSGNALIAMQNAVNLQLLENATLRIYDMKGKVVLAQKVGKGNYHVQLQLPRGLYIAKATSGSWKQTIKVAVK